MRVAVVQEKYNSICNKKTDCSPCTVPLSVVRDMATAAASVNVDALPVDALPSEVADVETNNYFGALDPPKPKVMSLNPSVTFGSSPVSSGDAPKLAASSSLTNFSAVTTSIDDLMSALDAPPPSATSLDLSGLMQPIAACEPKPEAALNPLLQGALDGYADDDAVNEQRKKVGKATSRREKQRKKRATERATGYADRMGVKAQAASGRRSRLIAKKKKRSGR